MVGDLVSQRPQLRDVFLGEGLLELLALKLL